MPVIFSNRRQWLLAGLVLGLAVAGIIFFASIRHESAPKQTTPPDSLSAYMLNAEDRSMLAEWVRLRRDGPADSLQAWVRRYYGPFQSIGLRLMEQATLFHGGGQKSLATAKFDTTRAIGEALAEVVNDSFLLHQLQYIEKLDESKRRSRAQASLLFATAEVSLYAGKYEDAVQQYEKAIALAQQANDEKLAIDASYRLLYFLDRQGKDQAVINDGEKVIAKAEQAGYQWRLALALCSVASAYVNLNQYNDAAIQLLQKAIEIAESMHDRKVLVRSYYNQAKAYYFQQKYQQTEFALQKVVQNDREKRWTGLAHLLQGHIDVFRGEYDRARIHYGFALKFFQQHDLDHLNEALTLSRLSILNILTGDYENALKLEKQSLTLRRVEKNSKEIAWSLSNLGFIYYKLDSLDKTIAMCQQAMPLFETEINLILANTWLIFGNAQFKKRNLPAASTAFEKAENIANIINNQIIQVEARIGHGQIALTKGELNSAKAMFSAALEIAQQTNEPSLIAGALFGLSKAEQRLNNLNSAGEIIARAITTIENLRSGIEQDSVRVSYFATTQEIFDQAILLALARREESLALHYAERARARALRDALGKNIFADLPKNQAEMVTAPVPSLQVLQQSIPTSVQVVEYRLTPDTLLIWLIDRQQVVTRRVAISSQVLEQIAHDFLQSLGDINLNAFKSRVEQNSQVVYNENRQIGRRLYQLVWEPIAKTVMPNKKLFIISDGLLHRVPFGALVTHDDYFFEEKYVWVKAPSLAILAENSHKHGSLTLPALEQFLMIAADDLPSVSTQKKLLSKLFINPSFLVKQEATYTALQQRLREGAHIVYFSLHAVADERFPMNSYIELYNNARTNGHVQKTKVYARELLQLNFSKTWLTVLNACETASGKIAAGEGVLNLVRIFALGNVPIVIASLWRNDDRVSALITGDLFTAIASSQDHTLALHQAKMHVLQKLQQDNRPAFPYFWAVFEVYQNNWNL